MIHFEVVSISNGEAKAIMLVSSLLLCFLFSIIPAIFATVNK